MTMTSTAKFAQSRPRGRKIARLTTDLWLVVAVIVVTLGIASQRPQLLDVVNIATVLKSFSIMVVMVLGLTWVIASGKIDVSFMQVAALSNMICAYALAQGWSWGGAIVVALLAGALVGLINGWLVASMRLPALIVTISTAGICASIAAALGKGTVIRIADPGPLEPLLQPALGGAVPMIVVPVLLIAAVAWFVQERLSFGRYIYALAQNEAAVRAVGVPVVKLTIILFVLSGVSSALAGILLASSLSSGQPMIGGPFLINGLTVVLLGGMMVRVGKPNILGTLTATLFIGVLFSGATLLGLPDFQRQIIQGALLLTGLIVATIAASHHGTRTAGQ
ncbi:ABC transporter permease [Celeribacter baekdonensis]|uniref:ABC transporter permease n=1 Tax=Celeribacter baekdonensis TaxID=875171 RepID=A0A2R4M4N9_9RHOB|nr:ABC transporter permease [Celeribacter baekdonensis]AVW92123.1 ABC transporter permease [Celeribacter baekdonensis]|tara:strand:+ start:33573 stop:34580 length:1008 start_codon:yes stop_codon:yes gene_type:complete